MTRRRYRLLYAPEVKKHLQAIDRKHHSHIRSSIEQQLWFEPDVETRNRKPLRRGPLFEAQWEIRCGPDQRFRVFYEIDEDRREVFILAVGVKRRSRLWIGGEEVTP